MYSKVYKKTNKFQCTVKFIKNQQIPMYSTVSKIYQKIYKFQCTVKFRKNQQIPMYSNVVQILRFKTKSTKSTKSTYSLQTTSHPPPTHLNFSKLRDSALQQYLTFLLQKKRAPDCCPPRNPSGEVKLSSRTPDWPGNMSLLPDADRGRKVTDDGSTARLKRKLCSWAKFVFGICKNSLLLKIAFSVVARIVAKARLLANNRRVPCKKQTTRVIRLLRFIVDFESH